MRGDRLAIPLDQLYVGERLNFIAWSLSLIGRGNCVGIDGSLGTAWKEPLPGERL